MRVLRSILLPLAMAALLLGAGSARAQVSIHFRLGDLPERPRLHQVRPGVQVVEGYPTAQVFYADGSYWCQRQDGWYRARSPRAEFYRVDDDDLPPGLVQGPAGPYDAFHQGDEAGRERLRQQHLREEAHERHEAEERRERARREHELEEHEEHEEQEHRH